jgi:hypothetical protein
MPRRGGKAARRQTRQKRAQRAAQRAAQPRAAQPRDSSPIETFDTSSGAAQVAPPMSAAQEAPSRQVVRRSGPGSRLAASGSSSLVHLRDDYHYVRRDLRNIALLTALIVLILAAATIAFNVLNLGPA